jgi:hypothetical protein
MRWPNSLAARVMSGYIHLKYDVRASDLRRFNPPMGALPFFNNSASPQIRRAELALVAGNMLKFLQEMGIPLERGTTTHSAHTALVDALEVETAPSSDMVTVIDEHYRFRDEADA